MPTPNICATRTASGHAQMFYLLDRPVYRGERARAKPLSYLGRVSEYYRASLGADPGYRGVLASNPVHDDYQTSYPRTEPYTLDQLAGAIPKGWRVPRVPTTAEGRNVDLFRALCKLALGGSDDGLLTWARTLNREFCRPPWPMLRFGASRRSVCRYRATLARPRASAGVAVPAGGTRAQGRAYRWAQGWRGVRRGAAGRLTHGTATVGRTWPSVGPRGIGVSVGRKRTAKAWGERVRHESPIQIVRALRHFGRL